MLWSWLTPWPSRLPIFCTLSLEATETWGTHSPLRLSFPTNLGAAVRNSIYPLGPSFYSCRLPGGVSPRGTVGSSNPTALRERDQSARAWAVIRRNTDALLVHVRAGGPRHPSEPLRLSSLLCYGRRPCWRKTKDCGSWNFRKYFSSFFAILSAPVSVTCTCSLSPIRYLHCTYQHLDSFYDISKVYYSLFMWPESHRADSTYDFAHQYFHIFKNNYFYLKKIETRNI